MKFSIKQLYYWYMSDQSYYRSPRELIKDKAVCIMGWKKAYEKVKFKTKKGQWVSK